MLHVTAIEDLNKTVEKLRKSLPELLTLSEYCATKHCCFGTAYNHLRRTPGLGVKIGHQTRFLRDVMLDEMARLPAWVPQKDRTPKARAPASKKSTRPRRDKPPRGEPDQGVRP